MKTWVLVTGGAGFIGVNLTKKLLSQGTKVLCVDNFSTSDPSNLFQFARNPNFQFIQADITKDFDKIGLEKFEIESIYNLACPASPPQYQQRSLETLDVNITGLRNLLEFAKKRRIKILQSSTSEVYGEPGVTPQPESYRGNVNCYGERACYDEGKRVAETYCFEYTRKYNVDARLVRIFNTYGPWLNPSDGRVVSNFVMQAITGVPITLYGDGQQSRSFCYVDDTVNGLIALMNAKRADLDEVPIYNIGNPIEITVKKLASTIIALTGSQSTLVNKPLPKDDPTQRCPDISKAKQGLDWEPKTLLEDGLRKTIEHFNHLPTKPHYGEPLAHTFTALYDGRRGIAVPCRTIELQIAEAMSPAPRFLRGH